MTPTAKGETRKAGYANSGVGEAQSGDQKERATIQSGDQTEWARRLKGGGDDAGRQQT